MQTDFSPEQLRDPAMAASEGVIRKCVHCGFCTATCPTYVLLGDERDSPRGRIYMIKDMLENARAPSAQLVTHVDRCLSCLSCMTTCPSGVNYMHLVDHARAYIETHYTRPWHERLIRWTLAKILPYPARFRGALALARITRPLAGLFEKAVATRPLAVMLRLAPAKAGSRRQSNVIAPSGARQGRVALLQGCAEPVLRPEIRAATLRLLARAGFDVVPAPGEGCCGSLAHHLGREHESLAAARANVDAWSKLIRQGGLEAIIITASGCGTTIKDYGFMLRDDPAYAERAAQVSALARDICEFLDERGASVPTGQAGPRIIAYQAACSLQHGQKITSAPQRLLQQAGFIVRTPAEAHLCCGSAGTYNILQPAIATQLRDRKLGHLEALDAEIIASGNIGCATQLQGGKLPVVHIAELLDWAQGGPQPARCIHLYAQSGHGNAAQL